MLHLHPLPPLACPPHQLRTPPATVYRPRQPRESDFHRLFREHFADFREAYAERYAATYGYWRPVIDKAVDKFLKCGDLQHGFARVRCPDCRHEFFVAFSCKQRCICPSCAQKRTLVTGLHVAEDVCRDAPHRQFVWTIPKRLRTFFRFDRDLLGELPKLAWQTVLEVYQSLLGFQARPGGILAIQTFGTLIHFHPHLHGLITDGAFLPDGRFVSLPANLTYEPFLRLWEQKVFGLLLARGKIEIELVQQMRCWPHSGFHVDRSVKVAAGDRAALQRLAEYLARCPFSLARLIRITPEGKVIYRADKEQCRQYPLPAEPDLFGGVARNFQVFEPLDFLAEITQHIPDKGEHLIRYYGVYANKARKGCNCATEDTAASAATPACQVVPTPPSASGSATASDNQPPERSPATGAAPPSTPAGSQARRRWAMLIQRIYQVDPLRCPQCGGTMRVVSFIEARQEDLIREILEHCGLWRAPPSPDPPTRAPPAPVRRPAQSPPAVSGDTSRTLDPDYLEYKYREQFDQPDLPWEA